MNIFVNGQLAAIKAGSTFEYIQENRLFTEAEGYSLEIEFPLKGCLQNQRIFGLITCVNIIPRVSAYSCVIQDINFYKSGTLTITAINDISVKAQFLEGASATNFSGSALDNTYINEVPVLTTSEYTLPTAPVLPVPGTSYRVQGLFTMPWNNNYSGNIQNEPEAIDTPSQFKDGVVPSYQIYLVEFIRRLSLKTGISINIDTLETSKYKELIICNALPSAWLLPDPCYAMPHWTIREFLEEVATFTGGVFTYDSNTATYNTAAQFMNTEFIDPDKVVDAYEMEVSESAAKNYVGAVSLAYADRGDRMWKYESCQWLIDYAEKTGQIIEGNQTTINNLIAQCNGRLEISDTDYWNYAKYKNAGYHEWTDLSKIIHNSRTGQYWMCNYFDVVETEHEWTMVESYGKEKKTIKSYKRTNIKFVEINRFHEVAGETEDAEEKELKIVPVWIDDCDGSKMYFIEHGEFGTEDSDEMLPLNVLLSSGQQDEKTEYLDKMYVAFPKSRTSGNYYCPTTDGLQLTNVDASTDILPRVYPDRKYKFKFLSADIPNVNAIFHIRGKRFLCSQLSTVFTTDGKSELIKGEFFLIAD